MSILGARSRRCLPLLFLVLLPVLLRLPALLGTFNPDPMFFTAAIGDVGKHFMGTPWIDPNVGFQAQALGKLSADQWLAGRIPWWNSYNGVGLPLAAEVQPASLFLPFVLLMHFRSGGMWLELLLQIIAGLCTFGLLRRIGLTRMAAFVGALIFELNGTFAWHGAPIASPIAFLPMLLLGIEQLRARVIENQKGGWVLIPVALAYGIYAGFPEVAYINGLLAGIWVLSRAAGMTGAQVRRFLGVTCWAAFIGLLCAAPLIVPFAEFLGRSYVGGHANAFVHASLPSTTLAQSFMPWLYGPIFAFDDPKHFVYMGWANIGGYFTALQVFMVLLGAFLSRRWLYVTLLAWMLLCLAKTYDIRPVSDLINLLPLIKATAFFRYAPPSWEFAGAVLCAITLDALQRRTKPALASLMVAFALAGASIFSALWLAKEPVRALLKNHIYLPYFHWSTGWAAAAMLMALLLLWLRHRWQHALHALAILLVLDASMAFALPLRSGMTHTTRHESGIAFLKAHIGLQRVYSLGPLSPNYGAFFQIAQINHNYLPVSNDWLDYLRTHINPKVNPIAFQGADVRIDSLQRTDELASWASPYEELGVKYVLAPPGASLFMPAMGPSLNAQTRLQPLQLRAGKSVTVRWVPDLPQAQQVLTDVTVLVGNYHGQSDGMLAVTVCNDKGSCSDGQHALAGSADNAPLPIKLDHPLALASAESGRSSIKVTITHEEGNHPVAVWLKTANPSLQVTLDDKVSSLAPAVWLHYTNAIHGDIPRMAYRGQDMAIYELPHPKPYFEITQGSCGLQPLDRETVKATCATASRLLRREAFYPGWRAWVDGREAILSESDGIFQTTALASGAHIVSFRYRPTHAVWILASFLIGLLGLAIGCLKELSRTRFRVTRSPIAAPAP